MRGVKGRPDEARAVRGPEVFAHTAEKRQSGGKSDPRQGPMCSDCVCRARGQRGERRAAGRRPRKEGLGAVRTRDWHGQPPIQSGLAVPCQNVLSDFPREFRSKVQTENKYLSSLFFIFTILGN